MVVTEEFRPRGAVFMFVSVSGLIVFVIAKTCGVRGILLRIT